MKAPTIYQIATAEPVGIIRDRVNYVVSSAPAELVGWLGAHAAAVRATGNTGEPGHPVPAAAAPE